MEIIHEIKKILKKDVGVFFKMDKKLKKKWKNHCNEWEWTQQDRLIELIETDREVVSQFVNFYKGEQGIENDGDNKPKDMSARINVLQWIISAIAVAI